VKGDGKDALPPPPLPPGQLLEPACWGTWVQTPVKGDEKDALPPPSLLSGQ
jgi:hypothetical protein